MTLADRVAHFQQVYAKWPAASPWLVQEQGRDVLYGIWVIGNDYRNKTRYYGAYPAGFLDRVMALFPDVLPAYDNFEHGGILHAFSGSLPSGRYVRLDINPLLVPDRVGSVYDAPDLFPHRPFALTIADPPYSVEDAVHYNTGMIDRRRAVAALAGVTRAGGHLVWLDTCWPMHKKTDWLTVGRILIQRSTCVSAKCLLLRSRRPRKARKETNCVPPERSPRPPRSRNS